MKEKLVEYHLLFDHALKCLKVSIDFIYRSCTLVVEVHCAVQYGTPSSLGHDALTPHIVTNTYTKNKILHQQFPLDMILYDITSTYISLLS